MAVTIRATVAGGERFQQALRNASPKTNPRFISQLLRAVALRTQAVAAGDKIRRGGSGPALPDRLTSRTGTGRRSISTNLSPLPRAAEVGSDLSYMAVHEIGGRINVPGTTVQSHTRTVAFGRKVAPFTVPSHRRRAHSARYPARPWLQPAVDDVVAEAPEIGARIWEAAI